jgi:hypothetical protein
MNLIILMSPRFSANSLHQPKTVPRRGAGLLLLLLLLLLPPPLPGTTTATPSACAHGNEFFLQPSLFARLLYFVFVGVGTSLLVQLPHLASRGLLGMICKNDNNGFFLAIQA